VPSGSLTGCAGQLCDYDAILKATGIRNYAIAQSGDGKWIQMWK
jgi:hypothetical protein